MSLESWSKCKLYHSLLLYFLMVCIFCLLLLQQLSCHHLDPARDQRKKHATGAAEEIYGKIWGLKVACGTPVIKWLSTFKLSQLGLFYWVQVMWYVADIGNMPSPWIFSGWPKQAKITSVLQLQEVREMYPQPGTCNQTSSLPHFWKLLLHMAVGSSPQWHFFQLDRFF